jgi:hypothetical protein
VHVAVYDVGGRFVATLREGFAVAGPLTLQWNGKNSRGHEAASGVYWIHAVAGGEKMARRVVLAR